MITVFYKCACLQAEASFEVRPRRRDEDVIDWMRGCVEIGLAADHTSRSPLCRAARCEYVKIPAPENASFLGGEPRLDA